MLGDDSTETHEGERWNKATRLAVAGIVAPHLRNQTGRVASRRVAKVDKDGNVVGYTTLAEVQEALLLMRQIELDVVDGVRPKEKMCRLCGRTFKVRSGGIVPKLCSACVTPSCVVCHAPLPRLGHTLKKRRPARCMDCRTAQKQSRLPCVDCGGLLSKHASAPGYKSRKEGLPPRCRACTIVLNASRVKRCADCDAKLAANTKTGRCRDCLNLHPKERARCAECGTELSAGASTPSGAAKRKRKPPRCGVCARKRRPLPTCFDCGMAIGAYNMSPSAVAARNGAPPRCGSCARRSKRRRGAPSDSTGEIV